MLTVYSLAFCVIRPIRLRLHTDYWVFFVFVFHFSCDSKLDCTNHWMVKTVICTMIWRLESEANINRSHLASPSNLLATLHMMANHNELQVSLTTSAFPFICLIALCVLCFNVGNIWGRFTSTLRLSDTRRVSSATRYCTSLKLVTIKLKGRICSRGQYDVNA